MTLSLLAAGELAAFHGLGPDDDRAAAEAAFGASGSEPDGVGPLMGVLTSFRRYPGFALAPHGVVVWFAPDDHVLLIDFPSPALQADGLLGLGEPELTAPSGLDALHQQLAWPSRGLAAHVSQFDGGVRALWAFRPLSDDEFRQWLASAQGPTRVRRG